MKPGMVSAGWIICVAMLVAACGGGGSSSSATSPSSAAVTKTVSGTAAAGAALVGTIEGKDSKGVPIPKVSIGLNGSYSLDLTAFTCPCMLKADGTAGTKSYTIYSAVTTNDFGGNINVTTLTDVIVGNVAGMTAANYYNAQPTDFSKLTSANLTTATQTLQTSLQEFIAGVGINPTTTDLLRTQFMPNSQGLDLVLDILPVTIDPVANTATITAMNGQLFVDNLSNPNDTFVISATGTPFSDLNAIAQNFQIWQNLFKTSPRPLATDTALLALFDQTPGAFLWSGRDLTRFFNEILLDPNQPMVGMTFAMSKVSFVTPSTATLDLILTRGDGRSFPIPGWQLAKNNNVWQSQGDQRKTYSDIGVRIQKSTNLAVNPPTTTFSSGLDFSDVEDDSTLQKIDYVVITGKGLPTTGGGRDGLSAGILMVKDPNAINASFYIAKPPYQGKGRANTPMLTSEWNIYSITDDNLIQTFGDNEAYTFSFYSDNNSTDLTKHTLVQQVVNNLPKPPFTAAERAAAQFPDITGPSMAALAVYANGGTPITVTWTLPPGLKSDYVEAGRGTTTGVSENSADGNVSITALTRTLDPLSVLQTGQTVTNKRVNVSAFDIPGRYFVSSLSSN